MNTTVCGLHQLRPGGVKQPHHVHLRDGVQTLHLNVHSHRNRRACKKMETQAEVRLLFPARCVYSAQA